MSDHVHPAGSDSARTVVGADGVFDRVESAVTRIGAIAGAVAALVAFVYVIGGAVMWLRFRNVGLPADYAVAQVPRSDLLVVGLRVMILPALAAGALLAGIALLRERQRAAQRTRLETLEAELAELPREPASDARRAQLEAEIAKDVADLSSAPGRRRATLALALLGALFVVLVLVLPITPGAIPWLGAVALAGYGIWATQFGHAPRKVSVWVLVASAIACSGFISVARQFDHPIQLLGAGVQVSEDVRVTGVLVASTREEVTLGFPLTGVIKIYQRKDVMDINIGPALDRQAPARSLLSYVIARHDPWAITPFELWCGGERYGWTEIPKLCRTRPHVLRRTLILADGKIRVAFTCPSHARPACSGWVSVRTLSRIPLATQDAVGRIGQASFRVEPVTGADTAGGPVISNITVAVARADQALLFDLFAHQDVKAEGGVAVSRAELHPTRVRIPVEVVVSLDQLGNAVIYRDGPSSTRMLIINRPPRRARRPRATRKASTRDSKGSADDTGGSSGNRDQTTSGTGTAGQNGDAAANDGPEGGTQTPAPAATPSTPETESTAGDAPAVGAPPATAPGQPPPSDAPADLGDQPAVDAGG